MKIPRLLLWLAISQSVTVALASDKLPVFTDVTRQAGILEKVSYGDSKLSNIVEGTGSGAMFFDFDADGWLDIYIPCPCWLKEVSDNRSRRLMGKLVDRLYRNNGDGTFTDISKAAGLDNPSWSVSAPWFDYDADGDLDVYLATYLEYDSGKFKSYYAAAGYPGPLSYNGQPDVLYRNNGDGTFTDVTKDAGVYQPNGRAMSATVADLNNDGLLDIYVANDAMENYYFRNLGNGKFQNDALAMGLAFGEGGQGVSSMGPAIGDVDRDGRLDIYIPDMGYGCLLMNRGDYFEDRTAASNLAVVCGQYTGWGGLLFDYDCDGYLDVFVSNGDAHHEYTEEAVLVRNDGKGNFIDVAAVSGPYFKEKYVGRGSTFGDYDNDGDLDLLIINLNDTPKLLRNDGGNSNNWLMVEAKLAGGKTDAIGARITVKTGSLVQIQDLIPVTGYLSQADTRCHFGLGNAPKVDEIEIRWPNGRITRLTDVKANQLLTVIQQPNTTEQ